MNRTRHLPYRQLPSRVPQTMMQHDRAPSENVCGSLSTDNSAASKQVPPEIIDRRQTSAVQGGSAGQWDWRSVIRHLPTSTVDNIAITTDTQLEFVAGSQNVIVLDHPDEYTTVCPCLTFQTVLHVYIPDEIHALGLPSSKNTRGMNTTFSYSAKVFESPFGEICTTPSRTATSTCRVFS